MALDSTTLDSIRDWVGSAPDDDDLVAAYDRFGDVDKAALAVLRRLRGNAAPQQWGVAGDYSQNDGGAYVKWLERQIARLEQLTGDVAANAESTVSTTSLHRHDNR